MDKTKQLGQYFTPDFVADFMVQLSSKSTSAQVLEPASGKGIFLDSLSQAGYKNLTAYEIDDTLSERNNIYVINDSFIGAMPKQKFDLIIGNPPYVRWKNLAEAQKNELNTSQLWKKHFNSLGDYLYIFILKSVELLKDGGELIFITPEYWLNTMHSQSLRNYLIEHGVMDDIYHFSETPIFSKVASSFIIFKYRKSITKTPVTIHKYSSRKKLTTANLLDQQNNELWTTFQTQQFKKNHGWILAPDAISRELQMYEESNTKPLGDIATIANGLVSGRDKAFKLQEDVKLNSKEQATTLSVLKGKDLQPFASPKTTKYIFLNETGLTEKQLQTNYPNFYAQLKPHKTDLLKRYVYNEHTNYWDWVFLRSIRLFKQNKPKILVPGKERITNKTHLRFSLALKDVYPTQDVTAIYLNKDVREDINYILALLNSKVTYDWVKYKGLIKGGVAEFSERPLASIPIKMIDWNNNKETKLHDQIVAAVKAKQPIEKIDELVLQLLK